MGHCPRCAAEIEDEQTVCPGCGMAISESRSDAEDRDRSDLDDVFPERGFLDKRWRMEVSPC
jgi:hypothetical protein